MGQTAANQAELSTQKLIAIVCRKSRAPRFLPQRLKGIGDHCIFISGDAGTARIAEIEHTADIRLGFRTREIAHDQTAHILREGNAKFVGTLARPPVSFWF